MQQLFVKHFVGLQLDHDQVFPRVFSRFRGGERKAAGLGLVHDQLLRLEDVVVGVGDVAGTGNGRCHAGDDLAVDPSVLDVLVGGGQVFGVDLKVQCRGRVLLSRRRDVSVAVSSPSRFPLQAVSRLVVGDGDPGSPVLLDHPAPFVTGVAGHDMLGLHRVVQQLDHELLDLDVLGAVGVTGAEPAVGGGVAEGAGGHGGPFEGRSAHGAALGVLGAGAKSAASAEGGAGHGLSALVQPGGGLHALVPHGVERDPGRGEGDWCRLGGFSRGGGRSSGSCGGARFACFRRCRC